MIFTRLGFIARRMLPKRKERDPRADLFAALRSAYSGYLPDAPVSLLDRFQWLVACARIICPEYRFKWPQMDWWADEAFTAYLRRFHEHENMNTDRRWNQLQLMRIIESVSGDTAECGCYKGAGSFLICMQSHIINTEEKGGRGRMHHIFDSCEGVSEPNPEVDGGHWRKYALAASEAEIQAALTEFTGQYTLYRGWIPERFEEVRDKRFAFVHVDVDLYQPTRDSLEFFYPRLSPGAVLLCDDYGFTSCPGATRAVDEFLTDKPEKMLALASGGGFFIKGLLVSAKMYPLP
jgi:hypothetical protein